MAAKARLILPKPPDLRGHNCWEPLRRELQRFNIHYTILGLTPGGRPSVKLVGTSTSLRTWLDQAGYDCVEVEA